jgi:hypothetical protein
MEQRIFAFLLIIEGTTERCCYLKWHSSQFTTKLWLYSTKNVFLNTTGKLKQWKIYYLTWFLSWKHFSDDLFRDAPYRLIIVLNKDALCHRLVIVSHFCWILPNGTLPHPYPPIVDLVTLKHNRYQGIHNNG